MLFKGSHFIPGFVDYQLDTVSEVIAATQMTINIIKKEYKKLSQFYKTNPELLFSSLEETRALLESKRKYTELSEFEQMTLDETNNILNKKPAMEDLFAFQNDFLLDSYSKVFRQIAKKSHDLLSNNPIVDIIYYGLTENKENVPIGECFSDGTLNTGSQISLRRLKVSHREVITKYQTLCN